jgi:hypothetical protein
MMWRLSTPSLWPQWPSPRTARATRGSERGVVRGRTTAGMAPCQRDSSLYLQLVHYVGQAGRGGRGTQPQACACNKHAGSRKHAGASHLQSPQASARRRAMRRASQTVHDHGAYRGAYSIRGAIHK